VNPAALNAFIEQAEAWKGYLKIRVRVVLAVHTQGQWGLWYSYTAFLPDIPENVVDTFRLETPSVRAFRDVLVLDDEKATSAISEMRDAPHILKSDSWTAMLAPTSEHLTFEYESLHPQRFAGPKRLPSLTASWHNQNYVQMSPSEVKAIDQELQLHEEPYDGFADLALALNVPVGFDELNKRRFAEVVLISPIELMSDPKTEPHSELTRGKLSLVLKAHPALTPDQLQLGIKALKQKGGPDRFTLPGDALSRDAEDLLRGKVNLAAPDVPLVEIFVSTK
jgi:hypothetical protein